MRNSHTSLRKDKKAVSPAVSTVILMAAAVVMILVAMTYANNILSAKVARTSTALTNNSFKQPGSRLTILLGRLAVHKQSVSQVGMDS
jgi:hypothetical protein